MSQQSQQAQAPTDHFDAAKVIVETLKGLDTASQALAMRFASETLGLQSPAVAQKPVGPITGPAASVSPPGNGGPTHSTDIKQFTAAKSPKTDQQFAAVVAYYWRFEAPEAERKETIDAETLLDAAQLVGRKRPGNAAQTLNNAKNTGYLDSSSAGKYRINSVGENLVAMGLPGNGSEGSTQRDGKKKKTAKKKVANKKSTGDAKKSKRGG